MNLWERRAVGHHSGPLRLAAVGFSCLLVTAGLAAAGCGAAKPGGGSVAEPLPRVPGAQAATPEPRVGDRGAMPSIDPEGWGPPPATVVAAFRGAGAETASIPLYVPTSLPAGTTVVPAPGPDALGVGPGEILRVRLKADVGWVLVMQGMAGDLGDLPGEECGRVAGRAARLYRVLGGELVQWSTEGSWYGVYGVGPDREAVRQAVVGIALGMVPMDESPGD